MAEQTEQTWLQRHFWPVAIGFVVVVAGGLALLFVVVQDSYRDTEAELNANYVELIDIRSTAGNQSRELIYVDDVPRYDCSEEDGLLDCDDDPQPTREQPAD